MGRLPVFRYYNTDTGDHFYTTNKGELGDGSREWNLEGNPSFYIEGAESKSNLTKPVPLLRWRSKPGIISEWLEGSYHLYTVDVNETPQGWDLEPPEMGFCESAEPTGFSEMIPLYRYRSEKNRGYFYTTNYGELGAGNGDWFLEASPMCYVYGNAGLPSGVTTVISGNIR